MYFNVLMVCLDVVKNVAKFQLDCVTRSKVTLEKQAKNVPSVTLLA